MALPPHVDINLNSDDNNKDTDRLKSSSKALAQHLGTVTLALRLFFPTLQDVRDPSEQSQVTRRSDVCHMQSTAERLDPRE